MQKSIFFTSIKLNHKFCYFFCFENKNIIMRNNSSFSPRTNTTSAAITEQNERKPEQFQTKFRKIATKKCVPKQKPKKKENFGHQELKKKLSLWPHLLRLRSALDVCHSFRPSWRWWWLGVRSSCCRFFRPHDDLGPGRCCSTRVQAIPRRTCKTPSFVYSWKFFEILTLYWQLRVKEGKIFPWQIVRFSEPGRALNR